MSPNLVGQKFSRLTVLQPNPQMKDPKENCVPACSVCNWSKSDMSESEFLSWISSVHNHSNQSDKSMIDHSDIA